MEKNKIVLILEFMAILLILLFVGSGVVVSPFYGDISMIDEGQFGAWLVHLLHGQHLYKDTYAAYGPLYIYPMYFLAKLVGPSVFLIRFVYIVLNVFFAIIIARLLMVRLGISRMVQFFITALLIIIPGFVMRQGAALLSLLVVDLALKKEQQVWSLFAGGVLAGTFLLSSDMGIFAGLIAFFALVYQLIVSSSLGKTIIKISLMTVSYAGVFLLFYLWSNHEGWFIAYIHSVAGDLAIFSGITLPNGTAFPNPFVLYPHSFSLVTWLRYIFSKEMLLYWLLFFWVITIFYLIKKLIFGENRQTLGLLVMVSIFGICLSTILIGRSGHFPFVLPPVFIVFGYFMSNARKVLRQYRLNYLAVITIGLIVIFSLRMVLIYRPHFKKILLLPSAIIAKKPAIPFLGNIAISNEQAKQIRLLQNYVWSHVKDSERIFFIQNEPMMYLLTNRLNATRYDFPYIAGLQEKRYEIVQSLITVRPMYIFDDTNAWSVDGISNRTRLPELSAYISTYYQKVDTVGSIVVYKLKIR